MSGQAENAARRMYEVHASPEAIEARLTKARIQLRAARLEVDWLEGLLELRLAEKSTGLWPRKPTGEPS